MEKTVVADTMVQSVLPITGLNIHIADAVGKWIDRAVDEHHL